MALTPSLPPLGFIVNPEPETVEDGYNLAIGDKAITLTKSAIHKYIDNFLSPHGAFRSFLTSVSSPSGIQYVTNLSFDEDSKEDLNARKTYLARFFAENTGRLPAVLIIDQGFEYVDIGINELVSARVAGSNWQGSFVYALRVSLSIVASTLSEEDTDTLSNLIVLMMGPLAQASVGYILRDADAPWEVRLPLSEMTIGQNTNVTIDGGTKTQVWTRNIDIICDFETTLTLEQELPKITLPLRGFVGGDPILPEFLNFPPNSKLPLGQPLQLFIDKLQLYHTLAISNPNIATITSKPPYYLVPRSQGKALIYVYTPTQGVGFDTTKNAERSLLMDVPFSVTL